MRMNLKRRALVAGLVVAALAAAAGFAYAQSAGEPTINACAKTDNGQLRLDNGSGCLSSERAVQWNQVGPQGPPGPPGVTRAEERFFARALADTGTWLPIVSGAVPDVRPTHVLTIHLAKGNYTVTAEIIATNDGGHGVVVCLLGNSTLGFAVAQSAVGDAPGFALQQTFENQSIFALNAPGDLELSCFNAPPNDPAGNPRIGLADVIATKIDTVAVSQEP
jgi:hypothetical protein